MPSANVGQCKLCLRDGQALKDSHILPAWAYRACQYLVDNKRIEEPIWVQNGKAYQTSCQVTENLLCKDCEQLIGQWERYVSRITFQEDGSCPAYSFLGVSPSVHCYPSNASSRIVPTTGLDDAALAKFAVSVIWRSHVSHEQKKVALGGKYAELFRGYLKGEDAFPERGCLVLRLLDQMNDFGLHFHSASKFPVSQRIGGSYRLHFFYVNGLYFQLYVGDVPNKVRKLSFFPPPGVVLLQPPEQMDILRAMIVQANKATVATRTNARLDDLRKRGKF